MCGEKVKIKIIYINQLGSPPRVRGKATANSYNFVLNRITPACAGKRPGYGIEGNVVEDHPRVCGEK